MADKQDAFLLVQLCRWGTELGLEEAAQTVFADSFDPEAASASDPPVARALEFGETVGALVKHGLLDSALVHDTWSVNLAWDRLRPAAMKEREKYGDERIYENIERLAKDAQ